MVQRGIESIIILVITLFAFTSSTKYILPEMIILFAHELRFA